MTASGAGDLPSLDGPSAVGERARRMAGDCAPADETAASDAHIPIKRKCGDLENMFQPFRYTDTARTLRDALTSDVLLFGRIGGAPISAVLTGLVPPRSPFRRPTSGSSWSDWRPVIGRAPGGSAGQLDYRRTTSPPTAQRGAGDARAARGLSPSPTSPSLRLAYGSSGLDCTYGGRGARGVGADGLLRPHWRRNRERGSRLQRRSTDASWCSLSYPE